MLKHECESGSVSHWLLYVSQPGWVALYGKYSIVYENNILSTLNLTNRIYKKQKCDKNNFFFLINNYYISVCFSQNNRPWNTVQKKRREHIWMLFEAWLFTVNMVFQSFEVNKTDVVFYKKILFFLNCEFERENGSDTVFMETASLCVFHRRKSITWVWNDTRVCKLFNFGWCIPLTEGCFSSRWCQWRTQRPHGPNKPYNAAN